MTEDNRSNYQVYRTQFPLVAAEALTIHKSQGATFQSICVNLQRRLSRELMYVALSRVSKLSNLYIVGRFNPPPAPKPGNEVVNEINRLKTERRLKICYNTLESKFGLTIVYHNVRSFFKYRPHIINDKWYSRADVLIFAESQTIASENPELPNFKLTYRFDSFHSKGPRGILVFIADGIRSTKIIGQFEESKTIKWNCTTFMIRLMKDLFLISGYKSPLTPSVTFENQITKIFNIPRNGQTILIGNFNFDAKTPRNTLNNVMKRFQMESRLKPNEITTIENTQIDVIYSNSQNVICGTYESYFSDHKPVFCMLNPYKIKDFKIKLEPQNVIEKPQPQLKPIPKSKTLDQPKPKIKSKPKMKPKQKSSKQIDLTGIVESACIRDSTNELSELNRMINEITDNNAELSNFTVDTLSTIVNTLSTRIIQ